MPTATQSNSQADAAAPEAKVKFKPDFGNGKYSGVASVLFAQSQFFLGLNDKQAEKLGKAYASDLGRINITVDRIGIGKVNKDGYVTIREAGVAKKIKFTDSMRIAGIVKILGEAYDMGVHRFNGVELDDSLNEWLNA